jgi:hypothetical protein
MVVGRALPMKSDACQERVVAERPVPYIETQEPLSMAAAPLALLETLVMDGPPVAV